MKQKILLILIFLLALFLRLIGLNWDQGNHLHPDERYLTMVVTDINLPSSIGQYFNTNTSPLNPQNNPNYQFFVYGTLPLFVTKLLAVILNLDKYDQIHLLGRVLSAIFDSLNIFLLFYLSRKKLVSAFIYSIMVLPIQLSHFFTVDTFLSTFILATFTALSFNHLYLAAIAYGLALACKISAIYFIPIILLYVFITKPKFFLLFTFYFLLVTFIVFRIFQPYSFTTLFSLSPKFIDSLKTLKQFSENNLIYPPSVQWFNRIPILFPLQNIILWGVGVPFAFSLFFIKFRHQSKIFYLALVWILFLIVFQGSQSTPTMRYFLPIYPFVALVISQKIPKIIFLFHFIYLLSFMNIYIHPHSRVQASSWINQNIPVGSKILSEYWDDALPLNNTQFQISELHLYDPESPDKWQILKTQLQNSDYLIMSSNRLWGSIPRVPYYYPDTTSYYRSLFNQSSQYKLVKKFTSYLGFSLPINECIYLGPTNYPTNNNWFEISQCEYPGIYLRDDIAEEAFTVYDHPQVLIFAKDK